MELNREQIKKALEQCANGEQDCQNCPYEHISVENDCFDAVKRDALALINELTAENDSLKQCMEHEHASFMETFGQYGEKCDRLAEEKEELTIKLNAMRGAANSYKIHYEEIKAENERLTSLCTSKDVIIEDLNNKNGELAQKASHFECISEVAVKNREECEQQLHYLSNVEIPYLYEALEGKGKDAEKLLDILAEAIKPVKADTVRKMQERLDKHFCHDPAFLGVEQRLVMDVIDQIAKELLDES